MIMTPKEYSEVFKLNVTTVRKLLAQNRIPGAIKIGSRWRIYVKMEEEL